MLPYKVTKKYARGPEQAIAQFFELNDARNFIHSKQEIDARMKVTVIYSLYDMGELMEESGGEGSGTRSATPQSQGSSPSSAQVFSPSPLQVAPRPGGMPPSSYRDVDDKNK